MIPAISKDIEEIMLLVGKAIAVMRQNGIDQWDELYPDRTVLLNDIACGQLFCAKLNDAITGIVALNEIQDPEYRSVAWQENHRPLIVHRLCIHPEYQRQGIARQIMQFAEKHARQHTYTSIRLDAFYQNPGAVALYDSLHYQRRGMVTFRKGDFFVFEKVIC